MTIPKLFQWLAVLGSLGSVWVAYVAGLVQQSSCDALHQVILVSPLYFLISFACYSLGVIGYRVATFNDCKDASDELQTQIREAHQELERQGYKYADDWRDE